MRRALRSRPARRPARDPLCWAGAVALARILLRELERHRFRDLPRTDAPQIVAQAILVAAEHPRREIPAGGRKGGERHSRERPLGRSPYSGIALHGGSAIEFAVFGLAAIGLALLARSTRRRRMLGISAAGMRDALSPATWNWMGNPPGAPD